MLERGHTGLASVELLGYIVTWLVLGGIFLRTLTESGLVWRVLADHPGLPARPRRSPYLLHREEGPASKGPS